MRIVSPTVSIADEDFVSTSGIDHIASCARICYGNDKEYSHLDNQKLYARLVRDGHVSMLRQFGCYYIIPRTHEDIFMRIVNMVRPYINYTISGSDIYISCNKQTAMAFLDDEFSAYQIAKCEAIHHKEFYVNEMLYYTFIIGTGIDITRELNRVSPNAIAERSTRYVDFNKKIGINFKKCHWMNNLNWYKKLLVNIMAKTGEIFYKISRSKYGLNLKPQDARWCLPLDTMSKVAYTYTVKEWRRILDLRYYGTTGTPHPDTKIVAAKIKSFLEDEGYEFK